MQQNSSFLPTLRVFLGVVYAFLNIGLPVYAVLFLTMSEVTASFFTVGEKSFLASTFFLVAIFIGLMQVMFAQYWPKRFLRIFELLGLPFIFMGIRLFFFSESVEMYLVDVGFVILMQMMLAFSVLVWGSIFLTGEWRGYTNNDWKGWLMISSLQLLFIIPGIGAVIILGRFLVFESLLQLSSPFWTAFNGLFFLLPVLINTRVIYHQMKQESIYASNSA